MGRGRGRVLFESENRAPLTIPTQFNAANSPFITIKTAGIPHPATKHVSHPLLQACITYPVE
jgi:hypothetical protein